MLSSARSDGNEPRDGTLKVVPALFGQTLTLLSFLSMPNHTLAAGGGCRVFEENSKRIQENMAAPQLSFCHLSQTRQDTIPMKKPEQNREIHLGCERKGLSFIKTSLRLVRAVKSGRRLSTSRQVLANKQK